jgi:hypothetical protein
MRNVEATLRRPTGLDESPDEVVAVARRVDRCATGSPCSNARLPPIRGVDFL